MIIDNPQKQHIPALRRLWQQAFGDTDEFLDLFFESGFSYDRCRCVFREGEPVAAHYLFDCRWNGKKVAYMYALAVEKNSRGQGLSRLLIRETHAQLRLAGYDGVILEPADSGLADYYSRLGYRACCCREEIRVTAGDYPAQCKKLGQLGYEQARRELLPPNGVEQDGAMTAFVHRLAEFYGGDGFVAAADCSQGRILEFLGDRDMLPGLLRTLKLEKATVRIPGGTGHTAMYYSLTGEEALPAYFGLPLD